ncbi:thioredoxin domain-containing protein [Luteibaculum oceani]|uniref:Thioredoxin domain-containing protein n=1 Tax=Luteibaculum oceani TaxID=1294296 RepID=A0A5C6VI99_9FLAO|nr:thioredoxin domain-containing protein [Luteibaculum oceani]TXC85222.1 thioredoxin domain-containing protein [Luteibaculum oceani]
MKLRLIVLSTIFITSCQPPKQTMDQEKQTPTSPRKEYTNALINEASPYLLQHAHNPVDWLPWGQEAFEKAKKENKLVLVSIGYSSCHWCHVMEHESFEDTAVAKLMNDNFICIKVDREERPDVDEIYMTAVQIMTQQGGWPLNCFTLPDGRPIYGGTYFRKNQWVDVLEQLANMYRQTPDKVIEYAESLTSAIKQHTLINPKANNTNVDTNWLKDQITTIEKSFDKKNGGHNGAPKFPMPAEWDFLLEYACSPGKEELKAHVLFTLKKMAMGGIYDHVGGGFARYSTDENWKVPHFEKMLYDNGQLLSVYSKAYRVSADPLFKTTVSGIIDWLKREMLHQNGGFYAALDADSEGEEGKFYVWTREELENSLSESKLELATSYFNFNQHGYWEHGNYIPLLTDQSLEILHKEPSSISDLKSKLLKLRANRVRPGLDDKQICSWNAYTVEGLLEAYISFGNPEFLDMAENTLRFLLDQCFNEKDKRLYHYYKEGGRKDADFLEDYAALIQALIKTYEVTGSQQYISTAKKLLEIVEEKFEKMNGFYPDRPSGLDATLITPTLSKSDNVTPSPNALLAQAKYKLGIIYYKTDWVDEAVKMANQLSSDIESYPTGYVNWLRIINWEHHKFFEIAVIGIPEPKIIENIARYPIFNKLLLHGNAEVPMLTDKREEAIYVCEKRVCKKPVTSFSEAKKLMLGN